VNAGEGQQHPWLRRYTLLGASALTVMAGATISPTIPAMQDHFSAVADVALLTRLVLTIPGLFIALFSLLAGAVVDRFGRKRLLILTTLLYALSGMAGLVLDDLLLILVSRALLGVAVAGVMTSATTLIGDYFQGPARDRFMGLQAAFMGFGGVVFLLAGGWLGDWHWRGPFAIYGLALLLIPGMLWGLYEPPQHRPGDSGAAPVPPLPRWRVAGIYASALLGMLAFYMVPVQIPHRLRELGVGMGLMMPNFSLWLMGFTPMPLRGRVIGGLTTAIFIGQFASPLVVTPLLTVTDIAGTLLYTGFGALALGALILLGVSVGRWRRRG